LNDIIVVGAVEVDADRERRSVDTDVVHADRGATKLTIF
jgi:hypothetical protein